MPGEILVLIVIGVVAVVFGLVVANARVKAAPRTPTPPTTTVVDHSAEDRLSRLADLRSKGLVDEAEYETERRKILGEI